MSSPIRAQEIEYPESDGRPMGETDLHRGWMIRILELLERRYRDQRVYVSGDLLVFYEEGNPKKFIVPDALVVKDCDPGQRRIFKIWEEGKAPDVVFETTSLSTRRNDQVIKPQLYRQLGVKEYFLYDPNGEYLRPALQGYRLEGEDYTQLEPDAGGALQSRELGLLLRLEGRDLAMFDAHTGERLQTDAEAYFAKAEAADRRASAAEDRAKAAEAEMSAARTKSEAALAEAKAAEARAEAAEAALEAERLARLALEEKIKRLGRQSADDDSATEDGV
jgi:Uma2 family endonuclease